MAEGRGGGGGKPDLRGVKGGREGEGVLKGGGGSRVGECRAVLEMMRVRLGAAGEEGDKGEKGWR